MYLAVVGAVELLEMPLLAGLYSYLMPMWLYWYYTWNLIGWQIYRYFIPPHYIALECTAHLWAASHPQCMVCMVLSEDTQDRHRDATPHEGRRRGVLSGCAECHSVCHAMSCTSGGNMQRTGHIFWVAPSGGRDRRHPVDEPNFQSKHLNVP